MVKSSVLTYLFILGAIGTIAWLWMAWAVRRRKAWARSAATAICVVAIANAVYNPLSTCRPGWGQPSVCPVRPGS
jgi:predicted permease